MTYEFSDHSNSETQSRRYNIDKVSFETNLYRNTRMRKQNKKAKNHDTTQNPDTVLVIFILEIILCRLHLKNSSKLFGTKMDKNVNNSLNTSGTLYRSKTFLRLKQKL